MSNSLKSVSSQKDNLQKELDARNEKIQEYDSRLRHLDNSLHKQKTDFGLQMQEATANLKKSEKDAAGLRVELGSAMTTIEDYKAKVQDLNKTVKQKDFDITTLKNQINKDYKEFERLKQVLATKEVQIKVANESVTKLKQETIALNNTIEDLKSKNLGITKGLSLKENKLKTIESDFAQLMSKYNEETEKMGKEIVGYKQEFAAKTRQLDELNIKLEKDNSVKNAKIKVLDELSGNLKQDNSKLNEQIAQLNKMVGVLELNIKQEQEKTALLDKSLNTAEFKNKELIGLNDKKEAHNKKLLNVNKELGVKFDKFSKKYNKMNADLKKLTSKNKSLKTKITKNNNDIKKLKAAERVLNNNLRQKTQLIREIQEKNQNLSQILDELKQENDLLRSSLENNERQIKLLDQSLNQLSTENTKLNIDTKKITAKISERDRKINQLREMKEKLRKEIEKSRRDVDNLKTQRQKLVSEYKDEIEEKEDKIAKLNANVLNFQTNLNSLQQEFSIRMIEKEDLVIEKQELKKKFDVISEQYQFVQEDLLTLRNDHASLEQKVGELNGTLNDKSELLTQKDRLIESLKKKLEELNKALQSLESINLQLKDRQKQLEKQLEVKEAKLKVAGALAEKLQIDKKTVVTNAEKDASYYESIIKELGSNLDAKEKEVVAHLKEISQKVSTIKQLKEKYHNKFSVITKKNTEITQELVKRSNDITKQEKIIVEQNKKNNDLIEQKNNLKKSLDTESRANKKNLAKIEVQERSIRTLKDKLRTRQKIVDKYAKKDKTYGILRQKNASLEKQLQTQEAKNIKLEENILAKNNELFELEKKINNSRTQNLTDNSELQKRLIQTRDALESARQRELASIKRIKELDEKNKSMDDAFNGQITKKVELFQTKYTKEIIDLRNEIKEIKKSKLTLEKEKDKIKSLYTQANLDLLNFREKIKELNKDKIQLQESLKKSEQDTVRKVKKADPKNINKAILFLTKENEKIKTELDKTNKFAQEKQEELDNLLNLKTEKQTLERELSRYRNLLKESNRLRGKSLEKIKVLNNRIDLMKKDDGQLAKPVRKVKTPVISLASLRDKLSKGTYEEKCDAIIKLGEVGDRRVIKDLNRVVINKNSDDWITQLAKDALRRIEARLS